MEPVHWPGPSGREGLLRLAVQLSESVLEAGNGNDKNKLHCRREGTHMKGSSHYHREVTKTSVIIGFRLSLTDRLIHTNGTGTKLFLLKQVQNICASLGLPVAFMVCFSVTISSLLVHWCQLGLGPVGADTGMTQGPQPACSSSSSHTEFSISAFVSLSQDWN